MRKLTVLFLLLLPCCIMAQMDTLIVSVGDFEFVMVRIEGGTFHRGKLKDDSLDTVRFKNSMGEHDVKVSSFYMGRYEVTQELYDIVTGQKPASWKPNKYVDGIGWVPDKDKMYPANPVEMVSWYDVQAFIDSLNKLTGLHFRLPTEAEWEYAARGGNLNASYPYAGSRNIDKVTFFHYEDPRVINTRRAWPERVGLKQPNDLGLYDMTGNVAEWCSDWFSPSYYKSKTLMTNPKGPNKGDKKVVRGGDISIDFKEVYKMEIRYRSSRNPDTKSPYTGFRLAMDAEPVKH